MSNLPNFPILRPSLLLDFANSKSVDPRITFTRASTATYYDAKGVLRTAASGVPRIDHDPVTGECNGLLIEEARTNLLTYSEQFDNAAWKKTDASVSANATTAPDGTLTAEAFIEGTSALAKRLNQDVSVTAGVTYTISVFAKPKGRDFALIGVDSVASAAFIAAFNFTAKTVTLFNSNGGTTVAATMQPLADGWFRCSATGLPGASCTVLRARLELRNGASTNYTGDGTSGIYIWGAQLE